MVTVLDMDMQSGIVGWKKLVMFTLEMLGDGLGLE